MVEGGGIVTLERTGVYCGYEVWRFGPREYLQVRYLHVRAAVGRYQARSIRR